MQYPGYHTGNVNLTVGDWFPFRIHNRVQLQDEAWYFVLVDINGLKHFMPAEFYEKYGLNPGESILCKIDKINCTGRIFLEPKHPFYLEGESYFFNILSGTESVKKDSIFVRDILGNSIEVPVYGKKKYTKTGKNRIRCIVKSIKKGIPHLEIA